MSDERARDGAAPTVPLTPQGAAPTVRLTPDELRAAVEGPVTLPVGTELAGRYRIERFVARGGMGAVYEAHDRELGVTVALKTVRSDAAWGADAIERFKREIHLARTVTHPGVCRIFDLGRHGQLVFLTMELLRGPTLADHLHRSGVLPLDEARTIVADLVAALDAAHHAGVVHRDLKPSNVMLVERRGRRHAVITDFGLARAIGRGEAETALAVGSGDGDAPIVASGVATAIAGTPGYMAPEQLRGGDIGPATDLYALGVVMHELVTGELPGADGPRLDGIDERWAAAIRRCLEPQPHDRYLSAATILPAIAAPAAAQLLPPRATRSRRRLLAVIGGPLLFLAIAVAALAWSRRDTGGTSARDPFERRLAEVRGLIDQARYGDAVAAAQAVVTAAGTDERRLAHAHYLLAEARMQHGELVAAEAPLRESIRLAARVGDDVTLASNWVALLRLLSQLGRLQESAMFAEVAEAAVVRAGGDPRLTLNLQFHLAATDAWDDRYGKAIARLEGAFPAAERALGAADPDLLTARAEYAEILVEVGRPADALVAAERERGLALAAFGADDFRVGLADYVRGIATRDLGDFAAARPLLERAVEVADTLDAGHPGRYHTRAELGRLHLMAGELDEAHAALSAALDEARELPGPDELRVGAALGHLADAHLARGELAEAERLWREALAIRRRVRGPTNVGVGRAMSSIGAIVQRRGDVAGARALYEEALPIVAASEIAVYPALTRARLGALLWELPGERERARALAREARPVLAGVQLLPGERPFDLVALQRWLADAAP